MAPMAVPAITDHLPTVRTLASKQREVYESGRLALVSHIRSYKEHLVCPVGSHDF